MTPHPAVGPAPSNDPRPNGSWSGTRVSFRPSIRKKILDRANGICAMCGQHHEYLEADHIIPCAEGGNQDITNGQALCPPCHWGKTKQEQARGRERRSPKRPKPKHPGLL